VAYNQRDEEGFISLYALRLRLAGVHRLPFRPDKG
jgi:hypothetical protein